MQSSLNDRSCVKRDDCNEGRDPRVVCSFKYFRVGPFMLEGKTKYSRKAFAEERPQKHQGKEIQAKLLVTEKK